MKFNLDNAVEVLSATPATLNAMLGGLSDAWTAGRGDTENWDAFDIVGHLIHGEVTDWVPRAKIILGGSERPFEPFDRFAQFERSRGKSLADLLAEFDELRAENLIEVRSWNLSEDKLAMKGTHPELGSVTLGQLLATWAVHDLNHIRQIAVSMAGRYDSEVGPWKEYLSILK